MINEGTSDNASTIIKSVNVLVAIRWIKQAWEDVSATTIKNCLRHCGAFPTQEKSTTESQSDDPFADIDQAADRDMASLGELVSQINGDVTAEQYVNGEEGLATCTTFDGADQPSWRERMRSAVVDTPAAKRPALDDGSSEEEVQCTSIKSFDVALTLARDLQLFLTEKGEEKAVEDQQSYIYLGRCQIKNQL